MSLQPWSNYSITVRAGTIAGEGVKSHPITCTTKQDGKDLVFVIKFILILYKLYII